MDESWWITPNQMTEGQKAAVQLPPEGNYLLLGPPGSGKTNILLMRAVYMHHIGVKNSRIVVFTRELADFIIRGVRNYGYPPDQVTTHYGLIEEFLRALGAPIPNKDPQKPFSQMRAEMLACAREALQGGKVGREYELLLIDEVQDFDESEMELFMKISEQWYVAGDDGQRVYRPQTPVAIDRIRQQATEVIELKEHYRIGLNIAALSDRLIRPDSTEIRLRTGCNYDEGSRPSSWQHHPCLDRAAQVETLIKQIIVQVQSYPGEEIGVLCHSKKDVEELQSALSLSGPVGIASKEIVADVDQVVKVLTIHAAKGLEFRAVHIVFAETLKKAPFQRNLMKTAVTRGKSKVDIYSSGDIPAFLQKAISSVERPDGGDAFAAIFKSEEA